MGPKVNRFRDIHLRSFAKNVLRMHIYLIPSREHLLACEQYYIHWNEQRN